MWRVTTIVLGAVGVLQFDVVSWRLKHEYGVECIFEPVQIQTARWFSSEQGAEIEKFKAHAQQNIARDGAGQMAYLAPSLINLQLTEERWSAIEFRATREMIG